jgi:hypothetical protein
MGFIMVLGFQNCGNSTFNEDDLIQDTPLSSIDIDDTKYNKGLSFTLLAKNEVNTLSEFKVQKTSDHNYSAQNGLSIITCTLGDPNPMEELMEITDAAKVTHPTFLSEIEICDPEDGKSIHFKIGETSPVYLVAYSQPENCLMDDPQRLMNEGKRVFIIENISFEEVETLVDESKALSETELCTVNTIELD